MNRGDTGELSLPERILAIAAALHDVPHAFGGAIALAYHAEPRATIDIDLNVFVGPAEAADPLERLEALGADVAGAEDRIARDGQTRLMWDHTPLDLFFAYDRFHLAAQRGSVEVPFAAGRIRILSATHLTVCKVIFDRPKDWVDIDAMRELGTSIDVAEALRWVGRIAGDADPRYDRIGAVLST